MAYRKYGLVVLVLCSLLMMSIAHLGGAVHPATALADDLLVNGNFDQLPFDWFYPNHFVARGWNRWWIHGTVLPEFDDVNKPNGARRHVYVDGGHAQVYFKWGNAYIAGLFQVVGGLTPCRPYELTMHARTHSLEGAHPGSRIGLDPWGAQLTPDGAVKDQTPLHRTVWSREQTALSIWEELSVTAEPIGNSLTAILYAAPLPGSAEIHYFDTFWDAGALRPVTHPNKRLPGPIQTTSGFISNVNSNVSSTSLTINWSLGAAGGTQVWYNIITPPPPPTPISSTLQLNFFTYMPIISRAIPLNFAHQTTLDYATDAAHSATIAGLSSGQSVHYIVVARRLVGGTCVTEYAGPYAIQIP